MNLIAVALLETVPAGVLLPGKAEDATDTKYRETFVAEVVRHLHGCRDRAAWYGDLQLAGRQHVYQAYTYAALAESWEQRIKDLFQERWEQSGLGIVRRLLHEDDHVAALVALDRLAQEQRPWTEAEQTELADARSRCELVIAGKDHSPESYAEFACGDTLNESEHGRFKAMAGLLAGLGKEF